MDQLTMSDAQKMVRGGEFYLMHINWFCPRTGMLTINYPDDYPDCSHVVIHSESGHWRELKSHAALVIGPRDWDEADTYAHLRREE